MLVNLTILIDWATRIHKIVKVLVRDAPRGAINADLQVYIPAEEEVLRCPNPDRLAKLRIRQVRKFANREDYLVGKNLCTNAMANPLIKNSKT